MKATSRYASGWNTAICRSPNGFAKELYWSSTTKALAVNYVGKATGECLTRKEPVPAASSR